MTVYGYGSADPKLLEKYDHLPPEQAIIRAWTEGEPSPRWHALAVRDVHNAMPLLARAIDRLIGAQITDDIEADPDEVARLTKAREQARNGQTIRAHRLWEYVADYLHHADIEGFFKDPSTRVEHPKPESTDLPEPSDPPASPQP